MCTKLHAVSEPCLLSTDVFIQWELIYYILLSNYKVLHNQDSLIEMDDSHMGLL